MRSAPVFVFCLAAKWTALSRQRTAYGVTVSSFQAVTVVGVYTVFRNRYGGTFGLQQGGGTDRGARRSSSLRIRLEWKDLAESPRERSSEEVEGNHGHLELPSWSHKPSPKRTTGPPRRRREAPAIARGFHDRPRRGTFGGWLINIWEEGEEPMSRSRTGRDR